MNISIINLAATTQPIADKAVKEQFLKVILLNKRSKYFIIVWLYVI